MNFKVHRKAILYAMLGCVLVIGLTTAVVGGIATTAPKYVFDDEFTGPAGSAPNPALWTYDLGAGGWGNGELQAYTSSRANSQLNGQGQLVIAITRAATGYQSARLVSKARFTEGDTIEARIKLDPRPGIWPAWWLLGAGKPWPTGGEVDMVDGFLPTSVQSSVHSTTNDEKTATVPADSGWHTYEVQWTPAGFTFYRDGAKYLTVTPAQLKNWGYGPASSMNMILNVAAGGLAGTPAASMTFPVNAMQVDWVRAWRS